MKMLVCNALTGEQKVVDIPDTTPTIPDAPIDTAPPLEERVERIEEIITP